MNLETLPHFSVGQEQQKALQQGVGTSHGPQPPGHVAVGRTHQGSKLQQARCLGPISFFDGDFSTAAQLGEAEIGVGEVA